MKTTPERRAFLRSMPKVPAFVAELCDDIDELQARLDRIEPSHAGWQTLGKEAEDWVRKFVNLARDAEQWLPIWVARAERAKLDEEKRIHPRGAYED